MGYSTSLVFTYGKQQNVYSTYFDRENDLKKKKKKKRMNRV